MYEATEGGAGVLSRLVQEPNKIAEVARAALELMHFENVDAAVSAQDSTLLMTSQSAHCVKGCYRCLLSYYNQPDHELIDRTDEDVCRLLVKLASSNVRTLKPTSQYTPEVGKWLTAFETWKYPAPSKSPLDIDGLDVPLVWREHRVAAVLSGFPKALLLKLEAMAFSVVILPAQVPAEPTSELSALLGVRV